MNASQEILAQIKLPLSSEDYEKLKYILLNRTIQSKDLSPELMNA